MENFREVWYRCKGKDSLFDLLHTHEDECEIIQIWASKGHVLISDSVFAMEDGVIYMINGAESHCTSPEDIESYERSKIIISSEFLSELSELCGLNEVYEASFGNAENCCIDLLPEEKREADRIFFKLNGLMHSEDKFKKAKMTELIIELLLLLSDKKKEIKIAEDGRIASVISYINENFGEELNIGNISRYVSMEKHYLCHRFKETLGITVMQYVLQRRLDVAKKMILNTDKRVSEIAIEVGFTSYSYFSRIFKKTYACSPRDYRKNKR